MANEFAVRDAGKVMLRPRGEYNPYEPYEILDMVTFEGVSYVAITAVTGIAPPDEEHWQISCQPNIDERLNRNSVNGISNKEVTRAFEGVRDVLKMIGIKNLLDIGSPSGSVAGITYSTESGIIVLDGTATETSRIQIVANNEIEFKPGSYHFSGNNSGGINRYYLRLYNDEEQIEYLDFGDGFYFDLDVTTTFSLDFVFAEGSGFEEFELRPMVTYSYDDESNYENFAPYNKGATVAVDDAVGAVSKNPVENRAIYNYINNLIIDAINGSY